MSTESGLHAMVMRAREDADTMESAEMLLEELREHSHFFWHDEIDAGLVLKCPDCGLTGSLQKEMDALRTAANTWKAEYEKLEARLNTALGVYDRP